MNFLLYFVQRNIKLPVVLRHAATAASESAHKFPAPVRGDGVFMCGKDDKISKFLCSYGAASRQFVCIQAGDVPVAGELEVRYDSRIGARLGPANI